MLESRDYIYKIMTILVRFNYNEFWLIRTCFEGVCKNPARIGHFTFSICYPILYK